MATKAASTNPTTALPKTPVASGKSKLPVTIENEFIRLVVNGGPNEAGRFSITTTGGDPSRPESKGKRLIYGGNKPWTSYTTVRLDNVSYVVGGPTTRRAGQDAKYGNTIAGPIVTDNQIIYRETIGDIEVAQKLGFVRGLSTHMLDTAGITYSITNHGTVDHEVGVRVLLDTMCGDNDGAPMRVGQHALTTATMLSNKEIPDFWQAFDNLAKPSIISQGSLRGAATTPPDKVIFADWGTLADDPWLPKLDAAQGYIRKGETDPDTAMAMLWMPVTLAPGKTITYVSFYGIGEVSLKPGQLTLGLTAPAETSYEFERTQPFTLTGYLQNVGGFPAHDVALTLNVPEGLTVLSGSDLQDKQDLLAPGDTLQKSWVIAPTGKVNGKLALTLSVTSSNIEANSVERTINVLNPKPCFTFKPAKQRIQVAPEEPSPVVTELNLLPAKDFYGFSVTVQFDPTIIAPLDISRGRAFVDIDKDRRFYWSVDKKNAAKGFITFTGQRIDAQNVAAPTITQAEVNLATLKFRTVKTGKTALTFTNAVLITEKGETRTADMTNGEIEVVAISIPMPKK